MSGGNAIQVIKRASFTGLDMLEVVDLSNSRTLLRIDDFAFLRNARLRKVALDGCSDLQKVGPNVFATPANPMGQRNITVSLRNVPFAAVPWNALRRLEISLDLGLEQVICDCRVKHLYDLVTSNTSHKLSVVNATSISCSEPKVLAGHRLLEVDSQVLSCDNNNRSTMSSTSTTKTKTASTLPRRMDLFHMLLVTVCVTTALLTGLAVFILVHCRGKLSHCCTPCSTRCSRTVDWYCCRRAPRGGAAASMASPLEDECVLCCDLQTQGGMLLPVDEAITISPIELHI